MEERIQEIIKELKSIIEHNGPDFLTKDPYTVYEVLIDSKTEIKNTAGLILYALVSDIPSLVTENMDSVILSKKIQARCSINKDVSDLLSEIFLNLYSIENKEAWAKKDREGLRQFLKEKFVFNWKGVSVWDYGTGYVNCYYRAEIVLAPLKKASTDGDLPMMLEDNPFLSKELISRYFKLSLEDYLDEQFEYYCTADDYYQPVCEDFDIDYYVSEWCEEHGFRMISCDGSGEDGGYEPKYSRGWY